MKLPRTDLSERYMEVANVILEVIDSDGRRSVIFKVTEVVVTQDGLTYTCINHASSEGMVSKTGGTYRNIAAAIIKEEPSV